MVETKFVDAGGADFLEELPPAALLPFEKNKVFSTYSCVNCQQEIMGTYGGKVPEKSIFRPLYVTA